MKTTELRITLTHAKPLPNREPLTDVIANRIYNFCFSQGCEVGVNVEILAKPGAITLTDSEWSAPDHEGVQP